MAFESVDVSRAREALRSIKNSLTTNKEQEILNAISDTSVFQTDAFTQLRESIKKLIETRYKDLSKLIDDYLKIVDLVEEYKKLEERIRKLERSIAREESEEEPDYSYIRSLRREIKECQKRMNEIVQTVDSMI